MTENIYQAREAPRIQAMLTRFLVPMLQRNMDILSVGCGAGTDVIILRQMGFNVSGIDPSRLSLDEVPGAMKPFLRVTTVEDYARETEVRYNFIYALDVIEHVGCLDYGTIVGIGAREARQKFLAACFALLKVGGSILLTTSNRLCPIDLGHWHKYHWLGRKMSNKSKYGLSIPWDDRNFLLSGREIRDLLRVAVGENFSFEFVKTAAYPTLDGARAVIRPILQLVDLPPVIGSPLAPILIVKITKTGEK